MTRKGRPRKPSNLKEFTGTRRKDREQVDNEPKPAIVIPPRPPVLQGDARLEWDRITPLLKKLGLLSKIDRAALCGYCQAWADFVWAVNYLRHRPRVIKAPSGYRQIHPAMTMRRQAAEQMLKFASEFGLTPSARTRVEAALAKPATDEEEEEIAAIIEAG